MFKFFKSIDNFLTMCEEYVEQRVWNGKFIFDLKYLQSTKTEEAKDDYEKKRDAFLASDFYLNTAAFLKHLWGIILQVPLLANSLLLLGDGIRMCLKYLAHYLVILITGLISASLLLNTFETTPVLFSILFIPILLVNHLLITSFFILADKREGGSHITFIEALAQIKPTVGPNSFLFLIQWSIMVSFVALFLGFSSTISYLFSVINIDWSSSFLYWMPVVMTGLLLSIFLYLILLVIVFSYIFIIFDKLSMKQAINRSWQNIQNDPQHVTINYIILSVISFIDILFKTANNYEGGFTVSILFASHAFFFLGYLLHKKYVDKNVRPAVNIYERFLPPFLPLIIFGFLSYIAVATFTVQQAQPQFMKFLDQRRQANQIKYEYNLYTNKDSDYVIEVPKQWNVYRWSDHSVTFHTNDNGTDAGNIRVDINVHPETNDEFKKLYNLNPGLVTYDTGTKNSTTKIANVMIQNDKAVKYTYTKVEGGKPEFQTHFLILHNKQLFDISFVTGNKNYEENYSDVLNIMITSFQFLK